MSKPTEGVFIKFLEVAAPARQASFIEASGAVACLQLRASVSGTLVDGINDVPKVGQVGDGPSSSSESACGLVAMTSTSHVENRQHDSGQV